MTLVAMKGKSLPSYTKARGRPSSAERMIHDLGNLLGALRLRVDILTKDSTCVWAQGANLQAVSRIVDETLELAARLESRADTIKERRRPRR
jgi:hypothetical protein